MSQRTSGDRERADVERTRWFLKQILPHEPALRAWLAKRGTSVIDIDDVIQETYAVFASMERVDDIRNPAAYLFQVARSQVVRSIRRARVVPILAVEDLAELDCSDEAQTPERQAIGRDELRRLAETVARMPEKTREAFILRRIRGVSQREIAARMGISESTVEKHIARGIRILIECIEHTALCQPACDRSGMSAAACSAVNIYAVRLDVESLHGLPEKNRYMFILRAL